MIIRLWGNHIAGPILAVIAIGLGIAAAFYTNDPTASAKIVKWSAGLTGFAAVFMIFIAQYDAWRETQIELESEQQKNTGSYITGNVQFGCIDFRYPGIVAGQFVWHDFTDQCIANFYISAVNHNTTPAFFNSVLCPQATIELKIGSQLFAGTYFQAVDGLAVKDYRRCDRRVGDSFFRPLTWSGLHQSKTNVGDMSFNIPVPEDAFEAIFSGKSSVRGDVTIKLVDSLGKSHSLVGSNLEMPIGRLCAIPDLEEYKA